VTKRKKRRVAPRTASDVALSLQLQVEQLRVQAVEDRIRLEQVADHQAKFSLASLTEMLTQVRLGLERLGSRVDTLRLRIEVLENELPGDATSPFTVMGRRDSRVPPS